MNTALNRKIEKMSIESGSMELNLLYNLSLKVRLNIFPVVLSTKIPSKKNFTMKKKKSDGTKANKPEYQEYNIKILKFRIQ